MYSANKDRYNTMEYKRCGRSGLKLSALSLGMWQDVYKRQFPGHGGFMDRFDSVLYISPVIYFILQFMVS